MIIKSKIQNIKTWILRILFLAILAVNIIFLYPLNQNASVVFGILTLTILFYLPETQIKIETKFIEFRISRLFGLYNTSFKLEFDKISKADFYKKEANSFIVLLPGFGGFRNAELIFHLSNGKKIPRQMFEPNEVINSLIFELEKRIRLEKK